ncbi:MAG: AMP-binding protein, partial [Solirubrobacterales bacterium]|nr:AMP-binding protein [Solirubrobacterales bacterium]
MSTFPHTRVASTMQAQPLLLGHLVRHATTVHNNSEVVTWTGESSRRTSFAELGVTAARLAHALTELGIERGDRVGTFMWNNAEHMTAYLAIPSMGAVLHAWNVRLFAEQLTYVANHGGASVLIADASLLGLLRPLLGDLTQLRHLIVTGPVDQETKDAAAQLEGVHSWEDLLAGRPERYDWPEDLDENDAAGLCYTSGTTGNPKGVAYSHRSNYLHSLAAAGTLGISNTDRALVVVPLFHANAWGLPYTALFTGASVLMPDRFLQGDHLAAFSAQEHATYGAGVPTIWTDLLRSLDQGKAKLPDMRTLLVGGSAAPPALIRGYWERHGIDILHAWGMTETSPLASVAHPPPGLSRD